MSRYPGRERKQTTQKDMQDSDKAIGGLHVPDLLTADVSETQLDIAQRRWNNLDMNAEGARIAQAFERSQSHAASAASAVATHMPPPPAVAAPMPPPPQDVIEIFSSDEEEDGAAVAQSPQVSRSQIAKPAPPKTLQETGRQSNTPDYDPSTHPQPGSQAAEAGNSDSNDSWIQDDSQDNDADSSSSQSSVRADWIYPNSGNGAAATADDANDVPAAAGVKRKADDANEVPVFGGNGGTGGTGGNDTGRSFVVQPDGSALLTDPANGTKRTSTWIKIAHNKWEKHHKDNV